MRDNQELTAKELDEQKGGDLSDKLLRCPMCNESQIKLIEWPADITICEVLCLSCHLNTGAKFTKKEAIKHWNTRAPSKQLTTTQQKLDRAVEASKKIKSLASERYDSREELDMILEVAKAAIASIKKE